MPGSRTHSNGVLRFPSGGLLCYVVQGKLRSYSAVRLQTTSVETVHGERARDPPRYHLRPRRPGHFGPVNVLYHPFSESDVARSRAARRCAGADARSAAARVGSVAPDPTEGQPT